MVLWLKLPAAFFDVPRLLKSGADGAEKPLAFNKAEKPNYFKNT
jgi:hypothetical protein